MSDQIEIVLQYLKIETNYAVIINGQYGIGKTHFYKNHLVPRVMEVSLAKNERKRYTPIHISLFGIKTLTEIQTAIFVELFPILKERGLKLATGIGKSIIRGIIRVSGGGDLEKYIGDISQEADEWLKYDELVLCFDDLDRKSDSLNIKDVFGFINSLVENQGVKILIIANEEQLIRDAHYSSSLREKVVGVSIQYKPVTSEVYRQIIDTRYSGPFKVYHQFLKQYAVDIIHIVELNESNFRNLIFFLEHFRTIFSWIENEFQSDKNFAVLREDKLKAVLDFTLAIAFEYKVGRLNATNIKEVESSRDTILSGFDMNLFVQHTDHEKVKEPTFFDTFKGKYFSDNKYFFFGSILEYILGIKAFSVAALKAELNGYFVVTDGKVSEQDTVLSQLGYMQCVQLSDHRYRELTHEMLAFVDKGMYRLRQYSTAFHFATRFDNLLNFNVERLKERFKKGINKGKSLYAFERNLGFHLSVTNDTEFKSDVTEVVRYCLDINDSIKVLNEASELNRLEQLFMTDFRAFLEKVSQKDSDFYFSPFWTKFDIGRVVKRIGGISNHEIWDLGYYFTNRHRVQIYEKLYPEKEFVVKLQELVNEPGKKRSRKTLQNTALNYLVKCLNECERNFPN